MNGISLKGFLHKTFRFISLIVLLASLSSCWHPPFDPDVSASLVTTEKLGSPVWEGRFSLPYEARGGYYLPSCFEPINYNQGFWIGFDETSLRMSHAVFDIVTKKGFLDNYRVFPTPNRDGLKLLPDRNNASGLYISLASLKGWYKLDFGFEFTPFTAQTLPFLGAGYINGTSADTLYEAYLNETQVDFYSVQTDTFAISGPYAYTALPANLPAIPTLAVMGTGGEAYISGFLADGTAVSYYWASSSAEPVILPIENPLTGILSDGRLLSDTGDRLYVYSSNGSSSFYIPTGALHFSFEKYDSANSQWISVFTRTLEIATDYEDRNYLISIYEIPTSRLAELAR